MQNLNQQFAEALGLPRNTTRAVLVLEVGSPPTLTITTLAIGVRSEGGAQSDWFNRAGELRSVPFKVRLDPYK